MATTTQKAVPKQKQHIAASMKEGFKIYGSEATEVRALDGVTVDFKHGVFMAIMGPSGSGKSTLLHCAAGLDKLSSGSAKIGATELGKSKDKALTQMRRDKVGFIFQSFNLVPTLTAKENILLPLSIAGKKYDNKWFSDLVELLGIDDRLEHTPSELSGGQQQRVAVARALISRPEIIFADEPSGNLDSKSGNTLLTFLKTAAKKYGQAIVMVTHDANAAAYADEVLFLKDGKIVDTMQSPTSEKILDKLKKIGD